MYKRSVLSAFTAVAFSMSAYATLAQDKPVTIGLALPTQTIDFFNEIREAVVDEARKKGVEVIVTDAHNDSAAQVSQIEDMLSRKISALIYIPAGASAAAVPVRAAKQAGVSVVTLDRNPPNAPGDTFIASDSVAGSKTIGDYLVKVTGGNAKVAVIQGQLGTTPQVAREKGMKQAFEGNPGMVIVAEQPADWMQDKAFSVAQDMLQKHPEITVFIGQADTLAMGAAQAIKVAHVDHKIWVVGFDGFPVALQAVGSGSLDATATQQTFRMGRMAVDSALDLLAKKDVPAEQLLDVTLTTKENAAQFLTAHP
jgi:ribose transport system substrate-binding protein